MGSSRLPGKTTKRILGRPMIERMIERVRHSRHLTDVVVATSTNPEDDPLEILARRIGVGCFRGSPDDVLARIDGAVRSAGADLIVELLGDNPLVHASLIDDVVEFHRVGNYDYSASVTAEYPHAGPQVQKFPVGVRVQVCSPEVIHRAARGLMRRSLAVKRDVPAGATLTDDLLIALRPSHGWPVRDRARLVGRTLAQPLAAGDLVKPEHLAPARSRG